MSEYCHVTLRVTLVVIIFVLVSVYLIIACNIPGAFPGSSADKESACNAGDPSSIWIGKIPWRREWLPTPVFWPGESHGLYSSWSCKESNTTERILSVLSNPNKLLQLTVPLCLHLEI